MKIQCDACEKAEAVVLCCADEAALCWDCDEKVHAANKLAGKHQRVPLLLPSAASATSKLPGCDICREKAGYFFCLEDRALLCKQRALLGLMSGLHARCAIVHRRSGFWSRFCLHVADKRRGATSVETFLR